MALKLTELQAFLDQAAAAATTEKEVRKSLARVETLVSHITKELTSIYELLDGTAPTQKARNTRSPKGASDGNAEAPTGRRQQGTPNAKPGRGPAGAAAQ